MKASSKLSDMERVQELIRQHERLKNDVEKVKAAQLVSQEFIDTGGCGWCWSELHVHGTCGVIETNPVVNQY